MKLQNLILSLWFRYHKSFTDAQNNNEISTPENYENTGRNEIFIKIYNMNGCATIKSFFVESVFVKLEEIEDFYNRSISNENDIENLGNFNLNLKKPDIRTKNSLNTTDKIRYYVLKETTWEIKTENLYLIFKDKIYE